jgi:Fe2+ transport system protein FeoA
MKCNNCTSCSSSCRCGTNAYIKGIGGRKTLGDLVPGDYGIVKDVIGSDDTIRRRILDMGITRGTQIMMIKKAPLGDPREYKVRGYSLCLRLKEANLVEIE